MTQAYKECMAKIANAAYEYLDKLPAMPNDCPDFEYIADAADYCYTKAFCGQII